MERTSPTSRDRCTERRCSVGGVRRFLPSAPLQRWLVILGAVSVTAGMVYSTVYWGYPWSLPPLAPAVQRIRWTGAGVFSSRTDGTGWTVDPSKSLSSVRSEPAPDAECCPVGRIVKVFERQGSVDTLAPLSACELSAIESGVLGLVKLAEGEPGYRYARRFTGIAAVGRDDEGAVVAFASFMSGEVSNDHHAAYEVLLRPGAEPSLLSSLRYFGDIAGVEGLSAFWAALSVLVMGIVVSGVLALAFSFE